MTNKLLVFIDNKSYEYPLDDSKDSIHIIESWKAYCKDFNFKDFVQVIVGIDKLRNKIHNPIEITHAVCIFARQHELKQDKSNRDYLKLYSIAQSVTCIMVRVKCNTPFPYGNAWTELMKEYGTLIAPIIQNKTVEELAELNLAVLEVDKI